MALSKKSSATINNQFKSIRYRLSVLTKHKTRQSAGFGPLKTGIFTRVKNACFIGWISQLFQLLTLLAGRRTLFRGPRLSGYNRSLCRRGKRCRRSNRNIRCPTGRRVLSWLRRFLCTQSPWSIATRTAWADSGAGRIVSCLANCTAASNTFVCSDATALI